MPIIANTTQSNTFSAVRAQLNSVTKRMNQFAVNESSLYANTIIANTSLKISGTLLANNNAGINGYYLRSNGSGVHWAPVVGFSKTFNLTGNFASPVVGTARFVPVSNTTITKVRLTNSVAVIDSDLTITIYKNNSLLRTFVLPVGNFTRLFSNTFTVATTDYLTVNVTTGSGSDFSMTISS
jgi:hypothetical protein